MPKAVAVQAVFMIGVIAITLFFIVAIFAQWIDITKWGANEAACTAKKTSYCSNWIVRSQCTKWEVECGTVPSREQCCTEVLRRNSDDPLCVKAPTCPSS